MCRIYIKQPSPSKLSNASSRTLLQACIRAKRMEIELIQILLQIPVSCLCAQLSSLYVCLCLLALVSYLLPVLFCCQLNNSSRPFLVLASRVNGENRRSSSRDHICRKSSCQRTMLLSDYIEIKIHILTIFHYNLVVAVVMFAESHKTKGQLLSSCNTLRANIS